MAAVFHRYKGRVVFGGNQIRDEHGIIALFNEQGASASSMVAAKLLDALSRMPDYDGENADAFTEKPTSRKTFGSCPIRRF